MITNDSVLLKISSTNFKYYKSKGYEFKKGDTISVDVKDLQFGTGVKVNVKCDICGLENKIYLQKYNMNVKRQGFYTCIKCSNIKRKNTNKEKYNVDNISQSNQIKKKKKITTLINYGVENPSQNDKIKNKKCETMLKNYGVKYVLQSKELLEKIKNTKLKIYSDKNYTNREQAKETCLKIYGVENPSQLESIKNEKCETSMKNYGVKYPSTLDIVKNKSKQTCLDRYGVKSYSMTDDYKIKTIKTNLERYGVESPMQNKYILLKAQKTAYRIHKYKNTNIYYQGSYELDFLNKFYNKIKISKIKPIIYFFNDEKKYYHPDFYNKKLNLIIEIKSLYTYEKELNKNLEKQKECIKQGYNFIFIIDKNYKEFDKITF